MNKLRFIRNTIYRLKRDYGSASDIYYDQTDSVDLGTGARTVTIQNIIVKRTIPLPRRVQDNSLLSAAIKELFNRGAVTDFGNREIMIDYRDLPKHFNFDRVNYIIFQNIRYEIVRYDDYETYAVVVSLKSTGGAYREAQIKLDLKSTVQVGGTIS